MSENLVQYVVAAGNGDTQAMGMLYAKTLKSSYFLASKLSGNDAKAVEIIKKAYARAFCSIEKLIKPEAFEIWLKQIIASIYKDGEKFIFADADASAQEPSGDFLPEAVLEDADKSAMVSAAVDKLTPERRTAIILHYNNGMPVNALSKFLGVSESTANAVLSKARADILAFSGIEAVSAPEFAALPVLTRLFADFTAKTGVDNDAVRDIFAFAIDAYKAAKEAEAEEEEKAQAVAEAEETVAQDAEESAEAEASEETAEEDSADESAEEVAEEAEEAEEASDDDSQAESDSVEDEEAVEEEKDIEAEIDEEKAQMEENILSFKNKISSMLGIDTEEKSDESAEDGEAEDVADDEADEEALEAIGISEDEETEETADEESSDVDVDENPVDDDAFDRIRRSVEGLDTIADISDEEDSEDDGAISFADYSGEVADVQFNEVVEEETVQVKPETVPVIKPEKKAAKVNPKMIAIAVAVLAVIIVAVALLVKGGSKDETPTTTAPASDTVKAPVKWTALSSLSDYKEIEFLNEKFNSFKDPDTGKYGLIDYLGNVVLAPEYDGFKRCSYGRYYGEGRLDESGYHVLAIKGGQAYEVVMMAETATVSNEPHAEHAYINSSSMNGGNYEERDRYYEGYAAVRKDGKWGYVAQNSGKLVVPYEFEAVNDVPADNPAQAYDYCRGSSNGYVVVKKDGKMGIIKIEKDAYKVVADFDYDVICQGKGGVFLAYNGTEWGTITVGVGSQADVQSEVTTLPPAITNPAEVSIGKYVVNDDETNIRTSPETDSDDNVITALNKGYEIDALEKKEGSNGSEWIRFEYEGKEAWVSSRKLDKAD